MIETKYFLNGKQLETLENRKCYDAGNSIKAKYVKKDFRLFLQDETTRTITEYVNSI